MPRALTAKLKSQSSSVMSTARAHRRNAGIGRENVEAAETGDGAFHRLLDRCAFAHVDADGQRARADFFRERLRRRQVEVGHRDADTGTGERTRDCCADAACRAGDEARRPSRLNMLNRFPFVTSAIGFDARLDERDSFHSRLPRSTAAATTK